MKRAVDGWLDRARKFAEGAEIAKVAGDMEAFVALITGAAKCVHIARLLERIDESMAEINGNSP